MAIGAGAGGLVSSIGASIVGGKIALIEKLFMGGDCLNTGLIIIRKHILIINHKKQLKLYEKS